MRTWLWMGSMLLISCSPVFADDADLAERVAALEQKIADMEKDSARDLGGYWKNGFIFESPDQQFKLQIGGRLQFDTAFFEADDSLEEANGEFDDGMKFRRARIALRGTLYDNIDFLTEYDFANSIAFRNVYLTLKQIPVIGNFRAGLMMEPSGLEQFCSNNYITFMERGFPGAFVPAENTGFMAFDHAADQHITWQVGIFKDTGNLGDSVSNEEFAVTARITGLPYITEDGRQYAHIGYSHSYRSLDDVGYRVRARPDSYIAPYVVDTKELDADAINLSGLEGVLTLNSLSLQGEYMNSAIDLNPGEATTETSADLQGYYVMASYLFTGEYRPYNRKDGTITRIIPKKNVTGGSLAGGAWEAAIRYGGIDLDDGDISGGVMDSYTLGINWYLNPHTRVMWNYVMADVEDEGDVDVYQMRVQFDF